MIPNVGSIIWKFGQKFGREERNEDTWIKEWMNTVALGSTLLKPLKIYCFHVLTRCLVFIAWLLILKRSNITGEMETGRKGKGRIPYWGQFNKKRKRTNRSISQIKRRSNQIESRKKPTKIQRRHQEAWERSLRVEIEERLLQNSRSKERHWRKLC